MNQYEPHFITVDVFPTGEFDNRINLDVELDELNVKKQVYLTHLSVGCFENDIKYKTHTNGYTKIFTIYDADSDEDRSRVRDSMAMKTPGMNILGDSEDGEP
jgi:hypothetical protein